MGRERDGGSDKNDKKEVSVEESKGRMIEQLSTKEKWALRLLQLLETLDSICHGKVPAKNGLLISLVIWHKKKKNNTFPL